MQGKHFENKGEHVENRLGGQSEKKNKKVTWYQSSCFSRVGAVSLRLRLEVWTSKLTLGKSELPVVFSSVIWNTAIIKAIHSMTVNTKKNESAVIVALGQCTGHHINTMLTKGYIPDLARCSREPSAAGLLRLQ